MQLISYFFRLSFSATKFLLTAFIKILLNHSLVRQTFQIRLKCWWCSALLLVTFSWREKLKNKYCSDFYFVGFFSAELCCPSIVFSGCCKYYDFCHLFQFLFLLNFYLVDIFLNVFHNSLMSQNKYSVGHEYLYNVSLYCPLQSMSPLVLNEETNYFCLNIYKIS